VLKQRRPHRTDEQHLQMPRRDEMFRRSKRTTGKKNSDDEPAFDTTAIRSPNRSMVFVEAAAYRGERWQIV